MPTKPSPFPRAFFTSQYDRTTHRWHWTIIANTRTHSREIARSIDTFPTEHDANVAAKDVTRQLRNAAIVVEA